MSDTIEALSATTIETVDPHGRGALPTCPKCVGILRLRHENNTRVCDHHGEIPDSRVIWIPYHREEQS